MKFDTALHSKATHPLPVFRIDSWGWRIVCPDQPVRDFKFMLRHRLAGMERDLPVTIMVHGGGFSPFSNRADSQMTIYARHLGQKSGKAAHGQYGLHPLELRNRVIWRLHLVGMQ